MKLKNNQNTTANSGMTRWSFGYILVLFILIVIVNSVFCAQAGAQNVQNEVGSLSALESRRFTIVNLTGDLPLSPLDLYGDFERPLPERREILPRQEANFEVLYAVGATYSAYARYSTDNWDIVTVTMRTKSGVPEMTVSYITAGLTSFTDTARRVTYIYRRY